MNRMAALLAILILFAVPLPASGSDKLIWFGGRVASGENDDAAPRCEIGAVATLKEIGQSGITRLKAKFELRDPTTPWWFGLLGRWYTRGYYYSSYFPNDSSNYWEAFKSGPPWFSTFVGPHFAVWLKGVGERPSFWQPDVVIHARLGDVGCDDNGGGITYS
jgi:hypothetical protein